MSKASASGGSGTRLVFAALGAGAGLLAAVVMHFTLSDDLAKFLLDKGGALYPLSEQMVMWIVFGLGAGELILRNKDSRSEQKEMDHRYLPEDDRTVLQVDDLGQIVRAVKPAVDEGQRFLPRLIHRVVLQFQSSRSSDQANSLLDSSLDLFLHEIDLRYSMLRYIMWMIPTLGFIGTVRGIAQALATAGSMPPDDPSLLVKVTGDLAVAFNTTLLALVMSAILVLCMYIIQAREERALNRAGQYCLDNLINRLYER